MKKYQKSIMFLIFSILFVGVSFVLLQKDKEYIGYAILGFTIAGIFVIVAVTSFFNNHNPNRFYESKVRDILNTYDSILVKSSSVPTLIGRNIILVESMEDLIDAQLELRKPICYLKQTESCSFILLDDKEAYIYVEKLNDSVESPVDIELNEIRIKSKNAEEMDSEMLRDIEKTTIVKLSNKKSYKVSPVRKNKAVVEEPIGAESEVSSTEKVVNSQPVVEESVVSTVVEPVNVEVPTVEDSVVSTVVDEPVNVEAPTIEEVPVVEPPVFVKESIETKAPPVVEEEIELI